MGNNEAEYYMDAVGGRDYSENMDGGYDFPTLFVVVRRIKGSTMVAFRGYSPKITMQQLTELREATPERAEQMVQEALAQRRYVQAA